MKIQFMIQSLWKGAVCFLFVLMIGCEKKRHRPHHHRSEDKTATSQVEKTPHSISKKSKIEKKQPINVPAVPPMGDLRTLPPIINKGMLLDISANEAGAIEVLNEKEECMMHEFGKHPRLRCLIPSDMNLYKVNFEPEDQSMGTQRIFLVDKNRKDTSITISRNKMASNSWVVKKSFLTKPSKTTLTKHSLSPKSKENQSYDEKNSSQGKKEIGEKVIKKRKGGTVYEGPFAPDLYKGKIIINVGKNGIAASGTFSGESKIEKDKMIVEGDFLGNLSPNGSFEASIISGSAVLWEMRADGKYHRLSEDKIPSGSKLIGKLQGDTISGEMISEGEHGMKWSATLKKQDAMTKPSKTTLTKPSLSPKSKENQSYHEKTPPKKKKTAKISLADLKIQAEAGDAESQFIFGSCYYLGKKGVKKDIAQAFIWFEKAAKQGHARAEYFMGLRYQYGLAAKKNPRLAYQWFLKSSKQGYPDAQYYLAKCYQRGYGVKKNIKLAIEWYLKSAHQGDADAQLSLGFCYYQGGKGVPRNLVKAAHWFEASANQGNASAQYDLGRCYYFGEGRKKDFILAFQWYEKAAKQGDSSAQNALGQMYYAGEGTLKDIQEAKKWLKLAYKNGNKNAEKFWNQHELWKAQ